MSQTPGVAIVGCGLIGQKRAKSLGRARLVACSDLVPQKAEALARSVPGCVATSDWQTAIHFPEAQIVVVATTHESLAEVAAGAIAAGRHVLVEKPGGRNFREVEPLAALATRSAGKVRVGFNHRYHRALRKARALVDEGGLGELMFVRARYGHGGRIGYEREWRADPAKSGGGELIDQGPHLIDLARWFLGDFPDVDGFAHTYYWDMPVDDNAFMLLKTADKKAAFLHASCTEWKNMFSFEIYGWTGKIDIVGLGGSYGTERLTYYRMLPEMGPPETTAWEYPMGDDSWSVEFSEFLEDIERGRAPTPGLGDAIAVLRIINRVYEASGYDYRT